MGYGLWAMRRGNNNVFVINNINNVLFDDNLDNFRANQLPGATRKTTHSVNKYINPIFYNDNTDNLRGNQLPAALKESHVSVNWYINPIEN